MSKQRKSANYKQCGLKKGNEYTTSWIPEQFAVKGKFIKLKYPDGTWVDGWEVLDNGGTIIRTAEEADKASQLYKKTRKASDI